MFDTSGAGKGLCVSATLLQILHPQEHAVWLCMWPLCALREQIHSWNVKFILLMLQLWVKLVPVLRDAHPICDIKFASVKTQVFWSACQVLLTFTNLETPQIHFLTRWAYPWNIPQWSQILKKTGILSETSEDGGLGLCSFEMSSFFWWYFSLWLTTHHHWISVALSISKFGQISPSPPISWNDPHSGFWKPMALQKKKSYRWGWLVDQCHKRIPLQARKAARPTAASTSRGSISVGVLNLNQASTWKPIGNQTQYFNLLNCCFWAFGLLFVKMSFKDKFAILWDRTWKCLKHWICGARSNFKWHKRFHVSKFEDM